MGLFWASHLYSVFVSALVGQALIFGTANMFCMFFFFFLYIFYVSLDIYVSEMDVLISSSSYKVLRFDLSCIFIYRLICSYVIV